MFFSKKKKEEPAEAEEPAAEESQPEPEPQAAPAAPGGGGGDPSVAMIKMDADVQKLKAQFTTFYELQKAGNERFGRIQEQIGELRTMMIERDKSAQRLEAKATQAIDMVATVQPDKFMVDMRKQDSKMEALKANIESNEAVQKNTINELKSMREKMAVFTGLEQVMKLNDEVKGELMDIKKIQSTVERHGDKVETIFSEMQKKTKEFVRFNDMTKDLDRAFKQISADFDSIKVKITDFGTKKEIENLISKFDDFEKYVGSLVSLMNSKFEKLEQHYNAEFMKKFEETDKLLTGFRTLAMKTPDLNKYFNLLSEEALKEAEKNKKEDQEKLKNPGEEEKIKVEKKETVAEKVAGAVTGAAGAVKSKVTGK